MTPWETDARITARRTSPVFVNLIDSTYGVISDPRNPKANWKSRKDIEGAANMDRDRVRKQGEREQEFDGDGVEFEQMLDCEAEAKDDIDGVDRYCVLSVSRIRS